MKKNILFVLFIAILFIAFPEISISQNITIKVKDNQKSPLFGATIQLKAVSDSTKKFLGTTNDNGISEFKNISDGLYIVKISYIGFQNIEKTISVKAVSRSFDYILKENAVSLGEVTISSGKPLIRQEEDKMIIDPKPMIGISTNTLEVLESTPGLFVDNEAGIYLTSATPAVIFVNGREQKLSSQDIMSLLRNLPPGSIEKIEVIRTPSTKYDAATSGGIINIILKKGMKIGRFGNFNLGMNQGKYGNRFAGFSLNNSGNNTTYYFNANFNRNDLQEDLNSVRYLKPDTSLNQAAVSRQQSNLGYLGFGIGYDVSKNTNLSYDGRISYTEKNTDSRTNTYIEDYSYLHLSESEDLITNNFKLINLSQDFGINTKLDTLGSDLDTKFSYNLSTNNSMQEYSSNYSLPFLYNVMGNGENTQKRHFFLFQSDLTYQLPHKLKIETGIKSSWQSFNSKAGYFSDSVGFSIPDTIRTNAFNYNEGINAVYFQASKTIFADIMIKAGCRLEHTFMKGNQTIPSKTNFIISRADFFPYVYISRRLFRMFGIELKSYLIYRRTITRPDYQNLNPYKKYIDPFLYETGNPNLKPQFTDNIEFNVSFEDMPVFAVGQNYTKDIFSNVVYSDENNSSIAVMTYDNLGTSKETYFRAMAGIPPGGKYFFALGAQYNLNDYNGYYEGKPFAYERGSWRLFTFHSLNLLRQTKLTLSGFMMVKGQQGFYELNNFGALNVGITQTLLNKNLTITVNVRDVLRTMVTEFKLNQGAIQTSGDRYSDNRRIGINIRYNFGLGKKGPRKSINTFEDEGAL
ncbi:MAG: outer membrane beta-barrel protein [Bacteroidia bacterium]|nr:outer membrane beta-barrel protein [Bacteroidia bacterium]